MMEASEWIVGVSDAGVNLIRAHAGKVDASYQMKSHAEAAVALVAIAHGFLPPRRLEHCDKPFE